MLRVNDDQLIAKQKEKIRNNDLDRYVKKTNSVTGICKSNGDVPYVWCLYIKSYCIVVDVNVTVFPRPAPRDGKCRLNVNLIRLKSIS